jgi:hypothetical protein
MGPYTVTVMPGLVAKCEQKSHLEYLQFMAYGQTGAKRWTTVNTGTLVNDFRRLFGDWDQASLIAFARAKPLNFRAPLSLTRSL